MVRYFLKVSLCALTLSSVSILGACGDDDGGSADGDDADDDDDDDDDGSPDAGDGEECGHIDPCPVDASEAEVQTGQFLNLANMMAPIDGSSATLTRTADGIEAEITVPGLTEGNVYSWWWVMFQNPENCTANPTAEIKCSPPMDNVQSNDGAKVLLTQAATLYAVGDTVGGAVIGADQTLTLTRTYEKGHDPTEGLFIPAATGLAPNYWSGLTDPLKAEIHIAVRDHGPRDESLTLEEQAGIFFSENCTQAGGSANCVTYAAVPFGSLTLAKD